jgi:hypothetical protein
MLTVWLSSDSCCPYRHRMSSKRYRFEVRVMPPPQTRATALMLVNSGHDDQIEAITAMTMKINGMCRHVVWMFQRNELYPTSEISVNCYRTAWRQQCSGRADNRMCPTVILRLPYGFLIFNDDVLFIKGKTIPAAGVETPTVSRRSSHRWQWGCQPHARATIYPQGDSWYSFVRGSCEPRLSSHLFLISPLDCKWEGRRERRVAWYVQRLRSADSLKIVLPAR